MSSSADKTPNPAPERQAEGERDEPFVRRWSRRKQEARAESTAVSVELKEPQAEPPPEVPQAPVKVLTDADMPPLESLDEKSDFSMFLSAGVSDALRQQALRKLFLLPSINQRCPLDSEYYDCRNHEPMGNIITHEMRDEMEREAQKLKEAMTTLLDEKQTPADPTAAPTEATAPAAAATQVEPAADQKTTASDRSAT